MDQLLEKLVGEIQIHGAIPFARFMELALYCPVYGYYEKEGDTVGREGDFYTSVSVGGLFGKLLAVQFAEWLDNSKSEAHRPQSSLQLIEGGAHNGELARDILRWIQQYRPALFDRLDYCIVEPSQRRHTWQKEVLADFLQKVVWVKSLSELQVGLHQSQTTPTGAAQQRDRRNAGSNPFLTSDGVAVRRIIFCNELLDAMPVHRWGWDAKQRSWFEWGVTLRDQELAWTRMQPPASESSKVTDIKPGVDCSGAQNSESETNSQCPSVWMPGSGAPNLLMPISWPHAPIAPALLEVLPDGFTVETSPSAVAWWSQAACVLGAGKLVGIDYGLTQQELFSPERATGTVRAYRRHHPSLGILTEPGQQDLTADVDFSAIQRCGETIGLATEASLTQSQFLTGIAARIWGGQCQFEEWTSNYTRQFNTLTNPEHLGHHFRVLIQSKD